MFARLAVNFGSSRIADPAQCDLLEYEWRLALSEYHPKTVNDAISKIMKKPGDFWPTIGAVIEVIQADMPPVGRRRIKSESYPEFCRDGRTEAEEIAFRTAHVLRIRHDVGISESIPEPLPPPVPASDSPHVSSQLRALAKKRGYWKGE